MAPRVSEVDFGSVREDESLSDFELMERMHAIEKKRQELEKERHREELRKDPDSTYKAYRASHHFCHPRCGFVCDRRDEASWISHVSQCPWKIEEREKTEAQKKIIRDAKAYFRGAMSMREHAIRDIIWIEKLIQQESNKTNPDTNRIEYELKPQLNQANADLRKSQKLLRQALHDSDPAVAQIVAELYEKYKKMDRKTRTKVFIDGYIFPE